jgi:hypothetical protein
LLLLIEAQCLRRGHGRHLLFACVFMRRHCGTDMPGGMSVSSYLKGSGPRTAQSAVIVE